MLPEIVITELTSRTLAVSLRKPILKVFMTNYSLNDNQRELIYFWLAVLSSASSGLLLKFQPDIGNKIGIPSGFVIFGILILIFDNYLWRIKPFSYLVNIPNLNGQWQGINSRTNKKTNNFLVDITQTWRKIDIVVRSENTISSICSATLFVENKKNKSIRYIYKIEPSGHDEEDESKKNLYGEGCAIIRIIEDNGEIILKGDYFSSNFRGGYFSLTKIN